MPVVDGQRSNARINDGHSLRVRTVGMVGYEDER